MSVKIYTNVLFKFTAKRCMDGGVECMSKEAVNGVNTGIIGSLNLWI